MIIIIIIIIIIIVIIELVVLLRERSHLCDVLVLSRYAAPQRRRFRRGCIGLVRGRASNHSDLRIKPAGNKDKEFFLPFARGPFAANDTRFKQTFHMPRSTYEYLRSAVLIADAEFSATPSMQINAQMMHY